MQGSYAYQASAQIAPDKLVGTHRLAIQGGAQSSLSNCQVDIRFVGFNPSTNKSQYQVSYSACDQSDFLVEDPQQFTCDFF